MSNKSVIDNIKKHIDLSPTISSTTGVLPIKTPTNFPISSSVSTTSPFKEEDNIKSKSTGNTLLEKSSSIINNIESQIEKIIPVSKTMEVIDDVVNKSSPIINSIKNNMEEMIPITKKKIKIVDTFKKDQEELKKLYVMNSCNKLNFSKECNAFLLKKELLQHMELENKKEENKENPILYPLLDDPSFNIKIAEKKEFNDTKYDGNVYDIKTHSELLSKADFELQPHQAFVKNFLSFQTPYNSLLLYHGLGTGKTCSAIGVCEEMRNYMKQLGISKQIIIVASPIVQDNFRLQLFDERKLKQVNGLWSIKGCIGNKLIKEINPTDLKGISREKMISQINHLINASYLFLGYDKFANYIIRVANVESESYKTTKEKNMKMIKNFKNEFNDRLIVIDEVHNIRMTEDNENKKVALHLMQLVKYVDNMRLLLLSATPMYNSYKEIIWLLNLMNINDRRATVQIKDIFDKDGNIKETGKELLIRKATGYISFIRGENPYTFPYRVYPKDFSPEYTFKNINYPLFQMNGKEIKKERSLNILDVFLVNIGNYQSLGYKYIIYYLKKKKFVVTTKKGVERIMPTFENMESFGYTLLRVPMEALNIVYPIDDLKEKVKEIDSLEEEEEKEGVIEYEEEEGQDTSVEIKGGENNTLGIDPSEITGKKGLSRIMSYVDVISPPEKGSFDYRANTLKKYGRIFSLNEIGKYSSKIKNIIENVLKSEGLILIYSEYIDAGLIPIALALEEVGFTRFGDRTNSFFKNAPPKSNNKLTVNMRYSMITGDTRISPNNDFEMKALTSEENKNGNKIKVILISKAGAEGLDFKFIRQVHILEPWYNINRIEQIIGRAVRNFSHKDLPFEKRNVQIFMYGTILDKNKQEAADLYVYRSAELKAIQIGKVSRILKETAVDCIIHHDQTNFTQENISNLLNEKVLQVLSDGNTIEDFKVGDQPFSSTCDYMANCYYDCKPNKIINSELNEDTYNESFILLNSEKIIQKIKMLFKESFFYKKKSLINKINIPKPYPLVQIYAALTQMIEDRNEFIIDKYDRVGNLINIDEYYLFQPSELSFKNISLFDRSVPIDYKHDKIQFEIKKDKGNKLDNIDNIDNIEKEQEKKEETNEKEEKERKKDVIEKAIKRANRIGEKILQDLEDNFDIAREFTKQNKTVPRGDDNWYKHCGIIIRKMSEDKFPIHLLFDFLVEHIIDSLLFHDKYELLKYLFTKTVIDELTFEGLVKKYFMKKIIRGDSKITAIILFDQNVRKILIYDENKNVWKEGEPEDEREVSKIFKDTYSINMNDFNNLVGFIGYDTKSNYYVFKVRDILMKRHSGARCDEAGKAKTIDLLNRIIGNEKYSKENTKGIVQIELCILQEFIMRYYNETNKNDKIWFLNPELALLYNF